MGKSKTPTDDQYMQHLLLNDFTPEEANSIINNIHAGVALEDAKHQALLLRPSKPVPTVDMRPEGPKPISLDVGPITTSSPGQDAWDSFASDHPMRAAIKHFLVNRAEDSGPGAKAFVRPFTKGVADLAVGHNNPMIHEQMIDRLRKERAAESLQNHLMIQALQQSAYQTQMNLNKVIPATQNPPLADFAQAGQTALGPQVPGPGMMGMPRGR